MAIFIVRHAETIGNAARVIQLPDAPLSETGRDQAARLAERMEASSVARIVASDFLRAVQTAGFVSELTGIPTETESSLRERDFGDLRGRAFDTLGVNPFAPDFVPPNGETRPAFLARVARAWARITQLAAETGGNLLVVTHGQVCRALVEQHVQRPPGVGLPPMWGNTSVTEVQSTAPWAAQRINCSAHLEAVALKAAL